MYNLGSMINSVKSPNETRSYTMLFSVHPGRLRAKEPTAITHEKETSMIWTKPPGNSENQPLIFSWCNFSETKKGVLASTLNFSGGFFWDRGVFPFCDPQELTWLLELCFKWKAISWGENGRFPGSWRFKWRMRRMPMPLKLSTKCLVMVVVSNIFFNFHPYLGKMNPFLTNILQVGWNHQLAGVFTLGHLCLPRCSQAIAFQGACNIDFDGIFSRKYHKNPPPPRKVP